MCMEVYGIETNRSRSSSFQEKELRERVKSDFASLVQELFTNCFSMKNRFEEFR